MYVPVAIGLLSTLVTLTQAPTYTVNVSPASHLKQTLGVFLK